MPDLCPDGTHVWHFPNVEDFCTVCGLHQMNLEDAIREEEEYLSEVPPEPRIVFVPETH